VATLRVAVIGTGFFSHHHLDGWTRLADAELVALCGHSDRERLKAAAAQSGIARTFLDPARMLDEVRPDLVDIVTTPKSHLNLVRLAAARGHAIVCQKPLAPSFEDALAVVEAAEAAGIPLVVHENWRFRPWFREVKRLLEAGVLGEPYAIAFRMRPGDGQGPRAYLDRQPYFQRMPRFLIHETGVHTIDVFRFLMGEVTGVFARLHRLNPAIAGEDAGYVVFEFEGGPSGLLDANRLCDFAADNPRLTMGEFLAEGADARIRLDGEARLWLKPHGGEEREHAYAWEPRGYGGDSVFALQQHVARHLLHGDAIENAGRAYLRNLEVEEAIYRANQEARWISLAAT